MWAGVVLVVLGPGASEAIPISFISWRTRLRFAGEYSRTLFHPFHPFQQLVTAPTMLTVPRPRMPAEPCPRWRPVSRIWIHGSSRRPMPCGRCEAPSKSAGAHPSAAPFRSAGSLRIESPFSSIPCAEWMIQSITVYSR